jgi:hypothetical protein
MFLTKLKVGAAAVLCAGLFVALIGGTFASLGFAQETKVQGTFKGHDGKAIVTQTGESDTDFIRRISKDLRGTEPTPAEIHFFVTSKDAGRRQKLIDLFIQERQSKKGVEKPHIWEAARGFDGKGIFTWALAYSPDGRVFKVALSVEKESSGLGSLQKEFYKELYAAKDKGEVARVTQAYLDRLVGFVKANPKSQDAPDAMRQIVFVYESQGKTVEAGAWRARLRELYPNIPVSVPSFVADSVPRFVPDK